MNLIELIVPLQKQLPSWADHPGVVSARARSKEAADAERNAERELDRAQGMRAAADADAQSALSEKEAERAERASDDAGRKISDASTALDRARKAQERAARSLAATEAGAKREIAAALDVEYRARVKAFERTAAELVAAGQSLAEARDSILAQLGDPRGFGLTDPIVAPQFNHPAPILALAADAEKVARAVSHWRSRAEQLGFRF